MGGSQSTQTGSQGNLGQRVGQAASAAGTAIAAAPGAINQAAQTATALTQSVQGLAQALGPAANTLKLAMANLQRQQGATVGGCDCDSYFGGNDDADPAKGLREYEASLSSKAKEDVIRRLARALKRAGINVDPEGDLDEIVRQLVSQIPNPKNGKTFSNDAKAQEKVCRVIADVLNDEFTPGVTKAGEKFIDTSLSAVEMCRSVGEWAHSFASGVNTEFLAVHASVKNALRAVEILDQIMAEIYSKIKSKIEDSRDSKLSRETDPLSEIYTRAQNERRRQEMLLKNILHVQLAPAAKELEIAMHDDSEQNALIKRLGLKPGTSEFADSLAMAISGLGTAASIAQRVHKALKQVGLTVRQYLESSEFTDFQRLLDAKIESGSIKAEDLAKFLEAMETLRLSFSEREEPQFREALEEDEKRGGGHRRRRGGAGDDEETPVAERVERAATEKKLIIRDFAGRMSRHYDELLAAVKAMGPKLGREILLTDKTDALRDALARLSDMRAQNQRLELALVGRYIDADARERKERFVNTLRMISNACTSIMELEMYRASSSYFARLKAAIDAVEKTIDYFADVITKKFGGEPFDDDDVADIVGGADETNVLPEIARSGLSLNEAVNEFAYFYYVARVRANLDQTSAELDSYGDKYTELLGDAVAARLYTLEKERQTILARLVPAGPLNAAAGWLPAAALAAGVAPGQPEKALAAVKKWVNDEYDIKARFYRVLQAMDLYMKTFTTAIVKDPEAVRDIKKMLDGTQAIARWFSEQTGEYLWKAFERMGSTNYNNAVAANAAGAAAIADVDANPDRHYYERVGVAAANTFGLPEVGVQPTGEANDPAEAAKKAVSDVYEYFQALKNLVNAFARIGDKFGGRELRTQVFMSPAQMFKTLTDFLKQSALSVNAGTAAAHPGAASTGNVGVMQAIAAAATPYTVYFGAVAPTANTAVGNYVQENQYFALIIKAMAAKILTTLGVYDMFERTTPLFDLTPTRMIIGGGPDDDPEVLEGASELYFRLPRLAEFYRGFLRWGDTSVGGVALGGEMYKIAMLPELDGVFSGIIRLIFQKAASPETGDYSDSELRSMISEVNRIYEFYNEKSPGQATKAALSAFVLEVNRRYGLIKQKDMKEYWDMVNLARTGQSTASINDTNYAILPDEDAAEVDRRAPSDRYAVGQYARYDPGTGRPIDPATGAPYEPFQGRVGLDNVAKGMLRDFRTQMDAQFAAGRAAFGNRTYSLLIQQAESEIRRTPDRSGKLKVAFRLIQGSSVIGTDANKAFMFHETVVVGLNMLSAIEAMLRRYSNALDVMNPITIESAIMDAVFMASEGWGVNAQGARAAVAAVHMAAVGTTAQLLPQIAARLARYAGAGRGAELGGNVTWFDRYIYLQTAAYAGRSGLPLDVVAGDVLVFLDREEAAFDALNSGLGPAGSLNRPSQFVHPDPFAGLTDSSTLTDKNGTAIAVAAGTAAAADAAGIAGTERFVRGLRMAARMLVDYDLIMRDFVEFTYDLSTGSNGLVEVRYTRGPRPGVQISFSKLRGLAETVLADVKFYFEQFRPFLSKDTVTRFESSAQPGSIYWIEDHLIDTMFRGKTDNSPDTLDGISRRANQVLQGLIRETQVQLDVVTNAALNDANAVNRLVSIAGAAGGPALAAANASRFEWFGQSFSALVYYNATGMTGPHATAAAEFTSGTGIAPIGGVLAAPAAGYDSADYTLSALMTTGRPGAAAAGYPLAAGPANTARFASIYRSDAGFTEHRSMLFAFNQLLSLYLATLTDTAGGNRIYVQLINAIANGTLSQSVSVPVGNTFPDIAVAAEAFGMRGDPRPTAVLFTSLAYLLQRLIKDTNPNNQVSDHLVSTLTDVPLYMKEAYRANLPSFIKLFDFVSQKGDFIKQLVQKVPIRLDRPSQIDLADAAEGGGGNPVAAAAAGALAARMRIITAARATRDGAAAQYLVNALLALDPFTGAQTSDQTRSRIVAIIDAISSACYTVSNSASEVLKEIGDTPVYFQTQEGSIETYKMRYTKAPLMPISLSLWFLGDINRRAQNTPSYTDLRLYPNKALGSPDFKILYGHRQLLARATPVSYEQMPGVKNLVDAYNGVTAKREQIDEGRYLKFVQNVVSALRFVVDARNYKSAIATTDRLQIGTPLGPAAGQPDRNSIIGAAAGNADGLTNYADAGAGVVAPAIRITGSAAYSLAGGAQAPVDDQVLLSVVENSNQDEEATKISDRIGALTGLAAGGGRSLERIYNLVDMNIIPINVHALMRDIPLANLYNYEFTFEQMVASMFGEQASQVLGNVPARTRTMFLRLLMDPYMNVADAQYGGDLVAMGSAGFVQRIFRGDNDLGMGRPKFLSDQLFNKALFGSIYQSRSDYDEAGPTAGIGASRGRQGPGMGPLATALNGFYTAARKMAAVEAAVVTAAVLGAALGANAGAVQGQVGAAQAPTDTYVFETPGNYENILSIGQDLEAAYQPLIGLGAAAGVPALRAALQPVLAQYRAEVLTKLNVIWARDQRRDAVHAGQGVRIAGAFNNNVGDALWEFASAHANSAHNRLMAVLNARGAGALQNLAAGERQAAVAVGNVPYRNQSSGQLTFLRNNDDDSAVVQVPLPAAVQKAQLMALGKARFDTTFVRNIFLVTNVLRLVRQKLNRELTQSRNVLVSSHAAVAAGVTEFGSDPFSPNEVNSSTLPGGRGRWADQDSF